MDNQLPKSFIILLAVLQGAALTLLYRSLEGATWPASDPIWFTSLATFVISFPLLTLLAVEQGNIKKLLIYLLPFCLLLSLLGGYIGSEHYPLALVDNDLLTATFVITSLVASFKALMYIQQFIDKEAIHYAQLFKLSWRNFLLFIECWLFVLIFWGILNLGAALFDALDIEFFTALLRKEWFWIPTITLAFAFASIVFRSLLNVEQNVATLLQVIIEFLLPVLTIVSLGFLATLPFAGLEKLWQTGNGTSLVLWLQLLTLFFVNTVYQQASLQRPYNIVLHRLIIIGVGLLPIYSLIAAYGLWLRVEQYGLSVARCWAILMCFLLACFSFGYLVGIIKKRDAWLEVQNKVNIGMGLIVLVSMLLVNSPILNFQRIASDSQIARLNDGKVTLKEFDYNYFASNLGRQGYLAMQDLKAQIQNSHPEQVAIIERMYVNPDFETVKELETLSEFIAHSVFWPQQEAFPDDLIESIFDTVHFSNWAPLNSHSFYFIAIDLNNDEKLEYVFIDETNHFTEAKLWFERGGEWQQKYMNTDNPAQIKLLKTLFEAGKIEVEKPSYNHLKVGDVVFKVTNDVPN